MRPHSFWSHISVMFCSSKEPHVLLQSGRGERWCGFLGPEGRPSRLLWLWLRVSVRQGGPDKHGEALTGSDIRSLRSQH